MKTMKYNLVSLFWILGLIFISLNSSAQKNKLTRQELKEVRKARLAANYAVIDTLLSTKKFVLVADYLQNRYGDRMVVTPTLNFIKINTEGGVLQTGSNTGYGYNGVGGVTAEGQVGRWEIFRDPKRMIYTVHFSLLTNIGHYDVMMTVTADASARATINGLGRDKLTWEGHIETLDNARVFKGQTNI